MSSSEDRLAMMRELHDTVTHCLSSVALQVMAAEAQPSVQPSVIAEIRRLTQEATSVLGLLEKLLQSADAPAPRLNTSALWLPTVVAGERQLSFARRGAHVDLSVPRGADRLKVTSRYVLVLALDLVTEHIDRRLPSGGKSEVSIHVTPNVVEFLFQPRSDVHQAPLPVPPSESLDQLRTRVDLVGGDLDLVPGTDDRPWSLALRLALHD